MPFLYVSILVGEEKIVWTIFIFMLFKQINNAGKANSIQRNAPWLSFWQTAEWPNKKYI